jgi:hypothetical protein
MFLLVLAVAAAEPTTAPAKDSDPVVCARQAVGSEVGTHMRPKKVCMKKSEWTLVEQHTKETLQSINGRGNNPGMAEGHRLNPE